MYTKCSYLTIKKESASITSPRADAVVGCSDFIGRVASVKKVIASQQYGTTTKITHSIQVKNSSITFEVNNQIFIKDKLYRIDQVEAKSYKQTLLVELVKEGVSECPCLAN